MKEITLKAHGKINLTLDVTGKRDDGYHLVEMIMQQVSLYDTVKIEMIKSGIRIVTDSEFIPTNEHNIAHKVAREMLNLYDIDSGVQITILKRIPVAAGMAGGSTDAAAVINGIDQLFELNLSLETRKAIGVKFGADIPYCIEGGTCIARGIGEELTSIPIHPNYWILLVKPALGVSTKEVYGGFSLSHVKRHPETEKMVEALYNNNIYDISDQLCNVLETVTIDRYPVVGQIKKKLIEYGATGVLMSGSGPTVFALYKSQTKAKKALKNVSRYYKETHLVRPITGGDNHAK